MHLRRLSAALNHRSVKLQRSSTIFKRHAYDASRYLENGQYLFTGVSIRHPFVWSNFRNKANDKKHRILHIFKTALRSFCQRLIRPSQAWATPENEDCTVAPGVTVNQECNNAKTVFRSCCEGIPSSCCGPCHGTMLERCKAQATCNHACNQAAHKKNISDRRKHLYCAFNGGVLWPYMG
jgi:hypothetical protein